MNLSKNTEIYNYHSIMLKMESKLHVKSKEILKNIIKSNHILLHCHPYPDPDSVCSVLAMREFLLKIDKNVTAIIGDSDYPLSLQKLGLEEKILPCDLSKVNIDDFDLFIILDSSSKSQISRKINVIFPKKMKTIVIDHHKTNQGFGDLNLVIDDCASTTHILYKLFRLWDIEITKSIALYIFLGLFADTGGFKYLNATAEVLSVASELVKINPNYHKIVFDIENSKKPIELEMMGLALSSLKKYFNGKVVFSSIPYPLLEERNISKEDAFEGLIPDILRSVVGWDIVASLVEVNENETVVSIRTRDEKKYDVSKIAISVGINGGGHRGAAGTTILKNIEASEKELIKAIKGLYNHLGSNKYL